MHGRVQRLACVRCRPARRCTDVEHYEISRYGTLRTWAEELGHSESVMLLQATLDEEKATDAALTELAESVVNQEAQMEAAE